MRPTLVLFDLHFLLFAPHDVTFSQQSIRNTSRVSSQELQKHTTHAKYKEGMQQKEMQQKGMQQKEMQQKEMQQEKMEKNVTNRIWAVSCMCPD